MFYRKRLKLVDIKRIIHTNEEALILAPPHYVAWGNFTLICSANSHLQKCIPVEQKLQTPGFLSFFLSLKQKKHWYTQRKDFSVDEMKEQMDKVAKGEAGS